MRYRTRKRDSDPQRSCEAIVYASGSDLAAVLGFTGATSSLETRKALALAIDGDIVVVGRGFYVVKTEDGGVYGVPPDMFHDTWEAAP